MRGRTGGGGGIYGLVSSGVSVCLTEIEQKGWWGGMKGEFELGDCGDLMRKGVGER